MEFIRRFIAPGLSDSSFGFTPSMQLASQLRNRALKIMSASSGHG
jgi:hypothetical protein